MEKFRDEESEVEATLLEINSESGTWGFIAHAGALAGRNVLIHVVRPPESMRHEGGLESFPLANAMKMVNKAYAAKCGHQHFALGLGELRGWWNPVFAACGNEDYL